MSSAENSDEDVHQQDAELADSTVPVPAVKSESEVEDDAEADADAVAMTDDGDDTQSNASAKEKKKLARKLRRKEKQEKKRMKREKQRLEKRKRKAAAKEEKSRNDSNTFHPDSKRRKTGDAESNFPEADSLFSRVDGVGEGEDEDYVDGDRNEQSRDDTATHDQVGAASAFLTPLREQEVRLLEIDNAIGSFPGEPEIDFGGTSSNSRENECEMLDSESDSECKVHTTSNGNIQLRERKPVVRSDSQIDLTDDDVPADHTHEHSADASTTQEHDTGGIKDRLAARERRLPDTHFFSMSVPNMDANPTETENLEAFLQSEEAKEVPDFAIRKRPFSRVVHAVLCSITNTEPIEIDDDTDGEDGEEAESTSSSSDATKPQHKPKRSNYVLQSSAMTALQEASEKYLVDLFREANLYAHSRGSATVTPKDFDLVFDVRKLYRDLNLDHP